MNTYIADNIEILVLSETPDSVGMIIPPEAYIDMEKAVKVSYGEEESETYVGNAVLRRIGNIVYADMILKSSMKDTKKALKLLSKLYPAVGFFIQEYHKNIVLNLKISDVFLTPYPNDSRDIARLGKRVKLIPNKKDLH